MLTVLTWLWAQPGGRTRYTAEHVNIWAAMVKRHLTLPHRIACVTDMPDGIDAGVAIIAPPRDFEDVRIPSWGERLPQCLRRLAMFRPDAAGIFGERFVCMDLDCVIAGSLDALFDRDEDMVMFRGTSAGRPYNGSMLLLTAGARPQVFDSFTAERAALAGRQFIGSDQAWIAYCLGAGEATWGREHGVIWHGEPGMRRGAAPHPAAARPPSPQRGEGTEARLVFYPGSVKPWHQLDDAWVAAHWRGDRQGRCLILGYAPSVWAEAEAALRAGPVAAVIASPEAAAHWRRPLLAVARSDREAEALAYRYGFEDVVFCGRQERAAA